MNSYSWEEIKKHNLENDCWVVLEGKIYDVSEFLKKHPGGAKILLENAGRDATDIFQYINHSKAAIKLREDFLIGLVNDFPICCPNMAVFTYPDEKGTKSIDLGFDCTLTAFARDYLFPEDDKSVISPLWALYDSSKEDPSSHNALHQGTELISALVGKTFDFYVTIGPLGSAAVRTGIKISFS